MSNIVSKIAENAENNDVSNDDNIDINDDIVEVVEVVEDMRTIFTNETEEKTELANVNLELTNNENVLLKMFELFLRQNEEELLKYKIELSPEIQKYFLEFCNENPNFFTDVEKSLKMIILDNEINSRDIPEILCLIIKIYGIIKHKKYSSKVDPYSIIELLIRILLVIHLKQTNKTDNIELINNSVEQIISIIRVAVELLKLPILKQKNNCCIKKFFLG